MLCNPRGRLWYVFHLAERQAKCHELLQPELQNAAVMSGALHRAIFVCGCVEEGTWEHVLVSCPVYLWARGFLVILSYSCQSSKAVVCIGSWRGTWEQQKWLILVCSKVIPKEDGTQRKCQESDLERVTGILWHGILLFFKHNLVLKLLRFLSASEWGTCQWFAGQPSPLDCKELSYAVGKYFHANKLF